MRILFLERQRSFLATECLDNTYSLDWNNCNNKQTGTVLQEQTEGSSIWLAQYAIYLIE